MSQSPNSTDTQAVLQSMLQRLKIQQTKDSEKQQQLHAPNSVVSTGAEGEVTEASSEKCNDGPADGGEYSINGIPSKLLRSFEANQSTNLQRGVVQKPVLNWEVDKGHISFPAQKDNSDGGTDQISPVGQDAQPRIRPAETGQLFPVELSKGVNVPSNRSNVETMSIGSMTVSQTQSQGFSPRVFAWSPTPTHVTGSPQFRLLPVENGEFGTSPPSKDLQITATDPNIKKDGFSVKQQSLGNKPRRWTQKIKARWKDRPGSFGKKQKEEQREAQQTGQQIEISPLKQLPTTNSVISTSFQEEEISKPEDTNNKVHTSDFDFSLGSFSLLEEITSGQEWATFLTPNLSSDTTDQRPSPEVGTPSFGPQLLVSNNSSGNQRGFLDRETSAGSVLQTGSGDLQPVSMDVSEEEQCAHREAKLTEPMEHGHAPSNRRTGHQTRPLSSSQLGDIQNNSSMRSRVQVNRKRHHHLTERADKDPAMDVNHSDEGGFTSSWSSSVGAMGASPDDGGPPSYKSPPLSPSFSPSLASPTKGVLKHSVSRDSQSSMEILTKRRRVEESRHVHFSEEVVTIPPPELDPDLSDPEENSGEEEDTVQELELEEEQAGVVEVAPPRRPALPAWILSLRNKNSQRKHRK